MKIRNRVISGLMTAALLCTAFVGTAFADENADAARKEGNYTASIHMYKADDPTTTSMCDAIFAHTADITYSADSTVLSFYVAYPIPAFPTQGTDGTIKDVVATYDGTEYTAKIDVTSKPEKTFDATNSLFGITAGDSLPTEVVTLTLPAAAIDSLDDGISLSVYVNSVMMSTQGFVLKGTDLTYVPAPTETSSSSTELTATVEKNQPSYTVTVPSTVALGTLSKTEDTSKEFSVEVAAENFDGDKVEVVAAAKGELTSGANTLAFANSFGTQTATDSATLTGTITVDADDVASAKAGNYTGTTSFTINYYAAE